MTTPSEQPQAASTTTPVILGAVHAVNAEIGAITKDRQTTGGSRFKFRGIDQVYAAIHPLFAKHGIIVLPQVMQEQREERVNDRGTVLAFTRLLMQFTFMSTVDGSQLPPVVIQGEAMDSGDKSSNKAMSVAMKYAIFQVFTVPTEETDDPDAEVHNVRLSGPQQGVQSLINDGAIKPGMVERKFGGRGVAQLTDDEAKAIINKMMAKVANDMAAPGAEQKEVA